MTIRACSNVNRGTRHTATSADGTDCSPYRLARGQGSTSGTVYCVPELVPIRAAICWENKSSGGAAGGGDRGYSQQITLSKHPFLYDAAVIICETWWDNEPSKPRERDLIGRTLVTVKHSQTVTSGFTLHRDMVLVVLKRWYHPLL